MNSKISLNKTHLQLIAVTAMVIDHIAWGFLDFRTPLAQVMHVIGRLTIPIMCFFIAEGYRKTHSLRGYINRLASFAVVSIVPFYLFFREEYGYRQSILFDHLLSLLMLAVLEHKSLKKWQKTMLVILLFAVSTAIAGWPVTPQLFTLAFYYGKTFKDKAKWVCAITFLTFFIVSGMAVIDQVFNLSRVNWTWYDRAYLLGFVLALPVIRLYSGEKGNVHLGRFFFYAFYPAHLLLLTFIKYLAEVNVKNHDIYLWFHVICLFIILVMLIGIFRTGASRMQSAVITFLVLESFYIVGFIVELLASRVETFYMAAAVEYFGELLMLVAVLVFTSECGRIRLPLFIYIAHILAALALVYSIVISPVTGFFYSDIKAVSFEGYTKPEYVHATGYYLSVVFILVIVVELFFIMINSLLHGSALEKKRVGLIFAAAMFIWIPYAITLTGITGGYEVPGLGVVGAAIFLTLCFTRYGTLNSVAIASENALEKAGEGVIIMDDRLVVTFTNALAQRILGDYSLINSPAKNNVSIKEILEGQITEISCDDKLYEVKVEELRHDSYIQGYTIWLLDATRHREQLDEAENMAFHDPLTGLYNRRQFDKLVAGEIADKHPGALVISDMDNFKSVNDTYGHRRGDKVLTDYADIFMSYPEDMLIPCRIGGDEFMFYIRGVTKPLEIEKLIGKIMEEFDKRFRGDNVKCTLSFGVAINGGGEEMTDFASLYLAADEKLYIAKENGKNTYVI